jgi:hypothetical protein
MTVINSRPAADIAFIASARGCWSCARDFAPWTSRRVRTQAQVPREYIADILDFQAQGIIILRGLLANGLAGQ